MAEIRLVDISKRFADGTRALERTDLAIHDGELFILVGPSGCGKSTLLEIVVGLSAPSTGEVLVDGEPVTRKDPKDRNMAMVFQGYAIYPHMTVRENLAFPLRLARLDPAEIAARVQQAAELLELGPLLERKPAALSGGQRQRVAMGRAIVRRPALFLLDEPLSNLDARLRGQMRVEIKRLQQRLRTTMLYVTHDQTEAMTLGDRVAVLRAGVIQQVGTPRQLYETPANLFVAGFIGAPAMGFLPAEIEGDRLCMPMLDLPLSTVLPGERTPVPRRLIVGIRPEHFAAVQDARAGTDGGRPLPCFRARVELIDWLGAEQHLHLDIPVVGASDWPSALPTQITCDDAGNDHLRLVARVESDTPAAEGQLIDLSLDPGKLSVFDAHTGERVGSAP